MAVMNHRFLMSWGWESFGRPVMTTGWLWVVDQYPVEKQTLKTWQYRVKTGRWSGFNVTNWDLRYSIYTFETLLLESRASTQIPHFCCYWFLWAIRREWRKKSITVNEIKTYSGPRRRLTECHPFSSDRKTSPRQMSHSLKEKEGVCEDDRCYFS